MEQFVVNTAGIVLEENFLSLKHNIPCDISVVFDTYNENPRKDDVYSLEGPEV